MEQKKNKAFVLSIVMLSFAVAFFLVTVLARPAGGDVSSAILCIYMIIFNFPIFVLSHIALIRGIVYAVKKLPKAQETIIMASIAVAITIMTFICLGYLLGTGRLPHEIYLR